MLSLATIRCVRSCDVTLTVQSLMDLIVCTYLIIHPYITGHWFIHNKCHGPGPAFYSCKYYSVSFFINPHWLLCWVK